MEGSVIRFGDITLDVLHTPGHTEGSVCLLATGERLLFTGDTLFAGAWGRTDLPGGSDDQMVESLGRLAVLDADLAVLPGHGQPQLHRTRAALAPAGGPARPTADVTRLPAPRVQRRRMRPG